MLKDEEIIEIRNRANLNYNLQIDPLPFARDIELAVLAKAGEQRAIDENANDRGEPDAIYLQLHDPESFGDTAKDDFREDGVTWCWHSINHNDVRYIREDLAHPLPAQAIPEGYQLAPMEPTASMLDAGVAMALQVSVHGEACKALCRTDNGWHDRGELPPVGVECEYYRSEHADWKLCKIEFIGRKVVVMSGVGGSEFCRKIAKLKFRPLKTEREKFVERFNREWHAQDKTIYEFAADQYDKGLRYVD